MKRRWLFGGIAALFGGQAAAQSHYHEIVASSRAEFERSVAIWVSEGYVPVGGPREETILGKTFYKLAMIRSVADGRIPLRSSNGMGCGNPIPGTSGCDKPKPGQCPVCGEMAEPYVRDMVPQWGLQNCTPVAGTENLVACDTAPAVPNGPKERITRCKRCTAAFWQDAQP